MAWPADGRDRASGTRYLLERYSICRSTVQDLRVHGEKYETLYFVVAEDYDIDAVLETVDLRGEDASALDELRLRIRNRYLDPRVEFPFGVVLTVIRYNGRLCFNFNHERSIVDTPKAEVLAAEFERTLPAVLDRLEREIQAA